MKLPYLTLLFIFASCADQYYPNIKHIVQKNCEEYVDSDDIKVIKKGNYFVATISNHPTLSKGYYFLVYGNEWDDAITVFDNTGFSGISDSLFEEIIRVNAQLQVRFVEIADVYINGKDSFAIRPRDVENKYLYKVIDVKNFQELLTGKFEYSRVMER